jgi:thiamine biosynthesis protein ThiC
MLRTLVILLAFILPAHAQNPPATPSELALGNKLMSEVNAGLACSSNLISAQQELAKAQARIRELETKAEPPK